jgi:hypothetical protein
VIDDDFEAILVGRDVESSLSIGRPRQDGSGGLEIPIRLIAPGLSASGAIDLESWGDGLTRLPAYVRDMATHWRGWTGSKDWRDDGGTVTFSATHDGVGLVVLSASVSNLPYDAPGNWEARTAISIEPGALAPIADSIDRLIRDAGQMTS